MEYNSELNSSSSGNYSGNHEDSADPFAVKITTNYFTAVCTFFVAVLAIFMNLISTIHIVGVLKHSKTGRNPQIFLASLSVMGILLGVGMLFVFVVQITGKVIGGKSTCYFMAFYLLSIGTVTVEITVFMSIERCIAIMFPFKSHKITTKVVTRTLAFIYLYSFFLASLPLALHKVELSSDTGVCIYSINNYSLEASLIVHWFVCNYLLSLFVMLTANALLIRAIRNMNRYTRPLAGKATKCQNRITTNVWTAQIGEDKKSKEAVNFGKIVVIMALLYSLSWLPYAVQRIIGQHLRWQNSALDFAISMLAAMDPFVNPLVCLTMKRSYRRGYFDILKKLFTCQLHAIKPMQTVFDSKPITVNTVDGSIRQREEKNSSKDR